jgi:hypothetical protein
VPSLVYSHILVYRLAMNVLYAGRYRRRFQDLVNLLDGASSVCDLCFGDTVVARWCAAHDVRWTGVDLNPHFCARARRLGYAVIEGDVLSAHLPPADVYLMAGSLYHFHDQLPALFDAIWQKTPRWILSEPVRNLSSARGLLGWWAGRSANPGDGHPTFRYTGTSLLDALREHQRRRGFTVRVVSSARDMVVVMERAASGPPVGAPKDVR